MRHIHRKLAEVSHWIMFPVLFVIILGVAVVIVIIQKTQSSNNSVLTQWVHESFTR